MMTSDAQEALQQAGFSRRGFFQTVGALVVGFRMAAAPDAAHAQTTTGVIATDQVDSWIAIGADGTVTGYAGKCDFGQGFRTVQMQLVAEELYVPFERVRMFICDTAVTPDQGVSSGSQGHPTQFGASALRKALATARDALMQMASQRFGLPMDQLTIQNGMIATKTDPVQQVSYGELISGKKFNLKVNANAAPKDPTLYTVLGTSVPRVDVPPKVTGQFQYVHQVRVPGMLHGRVVRPPSIGAKLVSVDEGSISGMPGNPRVVRKGDFLGVVAARQWDALQAAEALQATWSDVAPLPKKKGFYDYMRQQPSRDAYTVLATDVDAKLKSAAKVVSATYVHPYQMHGSMGTSCAVADVKGTGTDATATFWAATQELYPLRDSLSLVLGIPNTSIRGVFVEGSGCYGLNGVDSVTYDAAILSQIVGAPVRVQYTRKDEMIAGESYGPAYVLDMKGGLDENGQIIAWDYEAWTLNKGNRPNATTPGNIYSGALLGFTTPALVPAKANAPTAYSNNGNSASSYGAGVVNGTANGTGKVMSERVLTHTIDSPFFTGPLRSPNRLQNSFANECFMDELAAAAKADPVQFRQQHLSDGRLMDCVTAAANAANWDTRPSPKPGNATTGIVTGRGISCLLYEGNNGYCALVAEVEVNQDTGEVAVKRFVASQDSGPISNPDGIRNQMEGGALQGMSRAMFEEVSWNDQAVTSVNWRRYEVYEFGFPLPEVVSVAIDRKDKLQMGAGECVITAAGSAIGNAIFDATGVRIREIPFTADKVLAALQAARAQK